MKFIIFVGIILLLVLSPIRNNLSQMNIPEKIKAFAGNPIAPLIYIGFYILVANLYHLLHVDIHILMRWIKD
ncbi:MAG: hypothetical protein IBX70_13075 [Clostridia bacterium]|nr:hypothetical protein [Clostridia bacterium]